MNSNELYRLRNLGTDACLDSGGSKIQGGDINQWWCGPGFGRFGGGGNLKGAAQGLELRGVWWAKALCGQGLRFRHR